MPMTDNSMSNAMSLRPGCAVWAPRTRDPAEPRPRVEAGGAALINAYGAIPIVPRGKPAFQVRKTPSWPRNWANFSLF
jgi:hypothetical protein